MLLPFEVPLGYLRTTAIVPSKYYLGTFEIPLQYLKSTARVLSKYRTGTLQVPLSTVPLPYRTGTFVDVFLARTVYTCTMYTYMYCTCKYMNACTHFEPYLGKQLFWSCDWSEPANMLQNNMDIYGAPFVSKPQNSST